MNVYSCWYQGNFGYTCRFHTGKWMFVPEMGQIDNIIHKNLGLDDLTFKYDREKSYEMTNEKNYNSGSILGFLKSIVFPRAKSQTIAGMLLSPF